MNWNIAKIAAAGMLTAIPIAAAGIPVCAAETSWGTPIVLPAPLPADPQIEPEPPEPENHGEYYNPGDSNDWSDWYNAGAAGGGGGGG